MPHYCYERGAKMQDSNEIKDKLINEFSENYVEKIFYFCLKKTGNPNDADDLTQDIAFQIIMALNKGTIPNNFSAWIWQIARNRYSVWAKEKHNRNESVTDTDVYDYEIEDANESISDELIHSEQMALLRRELAFIKSDYRNIVVTYYIENKSIRDIASALSLTESAVKQRLFRARNILKEGMEMARTFGKRSYNPENITYAADGAQPTGLPWRAVNRKIPNNILLQANNNPSTLEELSIELGVALPYMEEEVNLLHQATLLEKQGDKYITNFFILDKECRMEIYNALRQKSKERSRLIRELIENSLNEDRSYFCEYPHIEDNTIRWFLVPFVIDVLIDMVQQEQNPNGLYGGFGGKLPKRANGESWGFVGYETVELPEITIMGCQGCITDSGAFNVYKCGDYSMWEQCGEPNSQEVELMCSCIKENKKISSLSDNEKRVWESINGRYAHLSEEGYLIPDIVVVRGKEGEPPSILPDDLQWLAQNVTDLYKKVETILKKYTHQVLHKNMEFYIGMELYAMRMMAIHDLVEEGYLKLPDDPSKSSLGMALFIN